MVFCTLTLNFLEAVMNEQFQHSNYATEFRIRSGQWWTDAVAYAKQVGPAPKAPYQVELHASLVDTPICQLRCIDCHGQFLRSPGLLTTQDYLQILDSLEAMGVPALVISGAYSDPTVNEGLILALLQRIGPQWGVRLHTYGLNLTKPVCQAILESALQDPTHQSYITISKVTRSPEVYAQMCRPVELSPQEALKREEQNLVQFFSEAESSPLHIQLNCRLTKLNSEVQHLAELLRWVDGAPNRVSIRFTTDYIPTNAPRLYQERFMQEIYLDGIEAADRLAKSLMLSRFHKLSRVSFRNASQTEYIPGNPCYNSLLFSAVSTKGLVFPCAGIASHPFNWLAYGDLKQEKFQTIWQRFIENYHLRQEDVLCARCVPACERQINNAIFKEVTNG